MTHSLTRQHGMRALAAAVAMVCVIGGGVPGRGHDTPQPGLVASTPESQIVGRFEKDPRLSVRLVADSSQVAHPVAFAVDDFGRVFVAETFRYLDHKGGWADIRHRMDWMDEDLACRSLTDRRALYERRLGAEMSGWTQATERVRLLEDPDEHGVFRRSSIFAAGFSDMLDGTIAGLLPMRDRVYVANVPTLWVLQGAQLPQSTGRTPLQTGFGVRLGYLGHDLHGLVWGPDGRLYFSLGDRGARVEKDGALIANIPDTGGVFRCEADGSNLELYATGLRNPQELAFDAYGNLWTCDNNADRGDKARWVWVLPGGDSGWRVGYQHLNHPVPLGAWTAEKIWYPPHPDQAGHIVPPVAHLAQGPSGVAAHPGTGLPRQFTGQFLVCDSLGERGGIYAVTVRKKGAGFEMLPPEKFLWSTPSNDVDFAPDGSVLFCTWTGGIGPTSSGALYRVESAGLRDDPLARSTAAILALDPATAEVATLGAWLEHPDMRVRRQAQFELVRRGPPAVDVFRNCIRTSGSPLARITSAWGFAQLQRLRQIPLPEEFVSWAGDTDAEFRTVVARIMGECRPPEAANTLVAMLRDPDDHVKLWAALALVEVRDPVATAPLADLAVASGDADPWLRHALSSALAACAKPEDLIAWQALETPEPLRRVALIALRKAHHPGVAEFLDDSSPMIVADAARAIYEERILPAFAALAGCDPEQTLEAPWAHVYRDPLLRRWMHVNLRIGTPEHAGRIARFATDSRFTEPLRAEAISLLTDWHIARPFDGVEGLYFEPGLFDRDPEAAASQSATVAKVLADRATPESVLLAALDFAAAHPAGLFEPALRDTVDSADHPPAIRAKAFEALLRIDGGAHAERVRGYLRSPVSELRRSAISSLSQLPADERLPIVRTILDAGDVKDSQTAIRVLGTSRDAGAFDVLAQLVDGYLAGTLAPALMLDVREAIDRHGDTARELSGKLAAAVTARESEDAMGRWIDAVEGGDPDAGQAVFLNRSDLSCVRCHQPPDAAQRVGPSLDDVGARLSRRQILQSIVRPSDDFAKGYETVTLILNDGTVVTGLLQEEFPDRVVLRTAVGRTMTIEAGEIDERTKGVSLMPEGLGDRMALRDVRDLVAYLATLRKTPESTGR